MSDPRSKILRELGCPETRKKLEQWLRPLFPDEQVREDTVQESLFLALMAADRYDAKREFLPWLCGIAQNVGREVERKQKLLRDTERSFADVADEIVLATQLAADRDEIETAKLFWFVWVGIRRRLRELGDSRKRAAWLASNVRPSWRLFAALRPQRVMWLPEFLGLSALLGESLGASEVRDLLEDDPHRNVGPRTSGNDIGRDPVDLRIRLVPPIFAPSILAEWKALKPDERPTQSHEFTLERALGGVA